MNISKQGKKLSAVDFSYLEELIKRKLPGGFKAFYLSSNGGIPEKDWWDSRDEYEPIRVKNFKSIAGYDRSEKSSTEFVEEYYKVMVSREVIPQGLLPFAADDGGNLFCMDIETGKICFYAIDAFDSDIPMALNQVKAIRYLASDFDAFVDGLLAEDEIG